MGLGESTAQLWAALLFALGTWDQTEAAKVFGWKNCHFWTWLNLGVGLVLLASAWTRLGQMGNILSCSPCPRSLFYPVFGLLMSSNSSAELFRAYFGLYYVHLASISLQMTNHFVSGLKGMVKMFKTMNKEKKKEKKELKKGTKKCLPSNVEGIYLFFLSI